MASLPKRLAHAAAQIAVLLCAGWYFKDNFLDRMPDAGLSDFRCYYLAAQHVSRGETPYLEESYLYPPLLACLLTPLAALNYVQARWVWFLFSHACLLAAAWLIWRRLGSDWVASAIVAVVWALGAAAGESLSLGQIGPQLTLLLAMVYTFAGRRRGTCIGTAFALKLIPGALGAILVLRRDWRALFAAVAAAALLLAVPWAIVACCLSGPKAPVRHDYLAGTPSVLSWSLPSVALRITEPLPPGGPMPNDWITGNGLPGLRLSASQRLLSVSVALLTLAIGCLVLAIEVRCKLTSAQVPLAGAAIVALALAASPVSWTHYQVMQYPGVALLLGCAVRRRLWWLLGAALACAAFLYPVPVMVLRAYYERSNSWPNSPAVMYFWTTIPAIASLVLFGLTTRELPRVDAAPVGAARVSKRFFDTLANS
jgi:alpha-1,2-mannosyltransferase